MSKNNQPKVRVRIVKEKAKKHPILATIGAVSFLAVASTGIAMAIPQSRDAIGNWVAQRFSPEFKDVSDTKDTLTISNGAYATQIEHLNESITETNTELDTAKAEKTELQTQLAAAQSRITTLEGNITTLTSQKTELQTQLAAANSDKESLQTQLNNKLADIESLNVQIAEKTSEITSLNAQITEKTSQIQSITTQLSTIQAENEQLKAFQYGKYVWVADGYEVYVSILADGTAKLFMGDTEDNFILCEYIQNGNDIIVNFEEDGSPVELNLTITSPTSLEGTLGQDDMSFVLLTDELQTVIEAKNTAQSQLEQANNNMAGLEMQLSSANNDIQSLNAQISNLNSNILMLNSQLEQAVASQNQAESDLATANSNIQSLNAQISEKNTAISTLETRLSTLEATLSLYTSRFTINIDKNALGGEWCGFQTFDNLLGLDFEVTGIPDGQEQFQFYLYQTVRVNCNTNVRIIVNSSQDITYEQINPHCLSITANSPNASIDITFDVKHQTGYTQYYTQDGVFYAEILDGILVGLDAEPLDMENLNIERIEFMSRPSTMVYFDQLGNIPLYYQDSFANGIPCFDYAGIPENTPITITDNQGQALLMVRDGDYLVSVINPDADICEFALSQYSMENRLIYDASAVKSTPDGKYLGFYTTFNDGYNSRQIDIESDYTITLGEDIQNYQEQPEEPQIESQTYTDGTTTLTINDDETFVLDENGTETTGTAYASVPQTQGVATEYFLVYQVDNKTKYALADISGTAENYTIVIDDTNSAYNNAKFSNNTEAFIPLTIDTSQGANNISVTGVQGATTNRLIFDGSTPRVNNLTLDESVYDVRLGDYLYITSGLLYSGTKESFRQNVTLSGDANQYFDVYHSTEGTPYYSVVFYGNSVYYAEINPETGTGTFTRIDSTISDVNKLSGTVAGSYDESTGDMFIIFTYLDNTTDTFKIVTEEFGGQYVELVEGE